MSVESLIGGSDSITTLGGNDIVIGGIDADTINAGEGNNIVLGDSGLARRLTANAAQLVVSRFSSETRVRSLVEIYRGVIRQRSGVIR